MCEPGSRAVAGPPVLERHRAVHHLTSRVRGRLRTGVDALTAYRACANMGTVTGAPKLRATEALRALEGAPRGFYGGAVGVLTRGGDLESALVIRAVLHRAGRFRLQAGAGIVLASDAERELRETVHKLRAPYEALVAAEADAAGGVA